MKLLNLIFAVIFVGCITGCHTLTEQKKDLAIMKSRVNKQRHEGLLNSLPMYDESIHQLGGTDYYVFTKQMLENRFDKKKFTNKSLHNYQHSNLYALYLLMLDNDPSIPQTAEYQNNPHFTDKAFRKKQILKTLDAVLNTIQDPDGRFKWFWEEPKCWDGNGTFFCIQPMLLIDKYYADQLPPEMQNKLKDVIKRTYPVFKKETTTASWSYVNPCLAAYTFSMLLAEQYVPEEFPQRLKEWLEYINYLKTKGIAENYTTTYLTVDMIILLTAATISDNKTVINTAKDFLDDVIFKQAAFFGNRFPAPYRRGYNGEYKTKRNDSISYLFGWSDKEIIAERVGFLTPVLKFFLDRFDIKQNQETAYPRELQLPIHDDCHAFSYLNEKFLLGAFDKYPSRDNIVWQCVTSGGSGWQDGPVYATFENKAMTSLSLRLEAVDADGTFRCHPFEGKFTLEKMEKIYSWRSFPPEPKIRTVLKQNHLLCLTKIDKVDAELQKLGFSLHFARFDGDILDIDGKPVSGNTSGPLIIRMDGIHVGLFPLKRSMMHGSNLWICSGYRNDFQIRKKGNVLDLNMYNLNEEKAELYTQNHAFGGFFMMVEQDCSTEEFIRKMKAVKISDTSRMNRINAAIDLRDAVRTVKVETGEKTLEIVWDHYPW